MKLDTTTADAATIVRCEGKLDSNTSGELHGHLDELIEGGAQKLLIDLSGVDFVSSAGLRVLLMTAKRLSGDGGLRISGLNESVNEVFEISGLSAVFDLFATEAEAAQDF